MLRSTVIVTLALVLAWGCRPSPGTASIRFIFSDPPPDDVVGFYAHLAIEERADPLSSGRSLASQDLPLMIPLDIGVDGVPNGDHRVAIIEIREGMDRMTSPVRFRGVSKPFSIQAGKSTEVEVAIELARVPEIRSIAIEEATPNGFVSSPRVTLSIDATNAVRIFAANDPAFSAGTHEEPRPSSDGRIEIAHDLDSGLRCSTACGDGPRTVFVRVVDEAGFASEVQFVRVELDTTAPRVLDGSANLELTAPSISTASPSPVIARPTAITFGSLVRLSFAMTEPLVETPTVAAHAASMEATRFALVSRSDNAFVYALAVDGTTLGTNPQQGEWTITVTGRDRAGNVGTASIALGPQPFIVDTAPPDRPLYDRLLYHRTPWGSQASRGRPELTLEGGPGTIGANETLIAFDHPDERTASEIGRSRASADGSISVFDLSGSDRSEVFVLAIDNAGNASAPKGLMERLGRVRKGRWTASLVGKKQGSKLENPNTFITTIALKPSRAQDLRIASEPLTSETAMASALDAQPLIIEVEPGRWEELIVHPDRPEDQDDSNLAYDSVRGVSVQRGGSSALLDTWEWDGSNWANRTAPGPGAIGGASLVYHAASNRVVLFGGTNGLEVIDETWTWNGQAWTDLTHDLVDRPDRRTGAAITYDEARGVAVLFGGEDMSGVLLGDTWAWDGSKWAALTTSTAAVSARTDHAMAYDSLRQRIVMFGGRVGATPLADVWEFDGAEWHSISFQGDSPSPRFDHAAVYDPRLGMVLVFGGNDGSDRALEDLWGWDGTSRSWTKVQNAVGIPNGGRVRHGMVYDSARGKIVVSGGCAVPFHRTGCTRFAPDTLEWDGRWLAVTPQSAIIDTRIGARIASNPESSAACLIGGFGPNVHGLDAWNLVDDHWITSPPPGALPAVRAFHAVAPDPSSGHLLLFGGQTASGSALGDTWMLHGFEWTQSVISGAAPSARFGHAMASDPVHGTVVLFGGSVPAPDGTIIDQPSETWIWSQGVWQEHDVPNPGGRDGHAMIYDEARGLVLLFGGRIAPDPGHAPVYLNDLWSWDGVQWRQLAASITPARVTDVGFAYDERRGVGVLFGGRNDLGPPGTTWEWNGSSWSQNGSDNPGVGGTAMGFDPTSGRVIALAGPASDATWSYAAFPSERPAQIFSVDFRTAEIQDQDVTGVEVSASAGAIGFTAPLTGIAQTIDGANLLAWDAWSGAWVEIDRNGAPASSPVALHFATRTATIARRFIDQDGELDVLVDPRAGIGKGSGPSTIALDWIEVTIDYALE